MSPANAGNSEVNISRRGIASGFLLAQRSSSSSVSFSLVKILLSSLCRRLVGAGSAWSVRAGPGCSCRKTALPGSVCCRRERERLIPQGSTQRSPMHSITGPLNGTLYESLAVSVLLMLAWGWLAFLFVFPVGLPGTKVSEGTEGLSEVKSWVPVIHLCILHIE